MQCTRDRRCPKPNKHTGRCKLAEAAGPKVAKSEKRGKRKSGSGLIKVRGLVWDFPGTKLALFFGLPQGRAAAAIPARHHALR
jgi:hypothetical protein